MIRLMQYLFLIFALAACSSEATETELLERARLAVEKGNVRAAVVDVKTALQENPDSVSARRLLGEIYLFQQHPEAAVGEFERALNGAEDNEVRSLYAQALVKAGQGDQLLELHNDESSDKPATAPRYLAALALAQAGSGNLQAAEASIKTALESAPDDPYVATSHAFFRLRFAGALEEARISLQNTVDLHPHYAEAWSLLGDIQQASEDLSPAESSYLKAVKLNPYRLSDRLNLVSVRLDLGKIDEAREDIKHLQASNSDHPGVIYAQGRLLLHSGDTRGALEAFNNVLGTLPSHAGSLYLAAIANSREGNLASALDQLGRFLALYPKNVNGLLHLANVHFLMDDPERAESIAREILQLDEENDHARRLLASALEAQDSSSEFSEPVNTDDTRGSAGLPQDGMTRFVSLNLEQVTPPLATRSDNVTDLATAARVGLQRGEFAEAEKHLRRALELEPYNTDLQKLVVDVLAAQGRFDEADAILGNFSEPVASEPEVLVAKGRIALARKRPGEAEPHLREALRASPNSATVIWLSEAMAAQSRNEEALELLNDWLAGEPDDLRVRDRLTYSYLQLGKVREATEQYRKILEQAPDSVPILNNLAWILRQEDISQALGYIEKANQLAPDNPQVVDTYAMIQLENGASEKALSLSQRALELAPNDPQILFHRALILDADGQDEEAIRILEALEGVANFQDKAKARVLLAELRRS